MHTKKQVDWNVDTQSTPGKRVYVAFPGMGKTTYALHHAGVVDLDFGSFRSALGVPSNSQQTVFGPFIKLLNTYSRGGFTVLTNEPSLTPYLKSSGYQVIIVVPDDVEEVKQRVLKRGSNPAFDKLFATHAQDWIHDWESIGKRYGVKVVHQKYFNIGGGANV